MVFALGYERGREEGLAKGLREAIHAFCQAFEIAIDAEREALLAEMGTDELKELQSRLLRDRRWS